MMAIKRGVQFFLVFSVLFSYSTTFFVLEEFHNHGVPFAPFQAAKLSPFSPKHATKDDPQFCEICFLLISSHGLINFDISFASGLPLTATIEPASGSPPHYSQRQPTESRAPPSFQV